MDWLIIRLPPNCLCLCLLYVLLNINVNLVTKATICFCMLIVQISSGTHFLVGLQCTCRYITFLIIPQSGLVSERETGSLAFEMAPPLLCQSVRMHRMHTAAANYCYAPAHSSTVHLCAEPNLIYLFILVKL